MIRIVFSVAAAAAVSAALTLITPLSVVGASPPGAPSEPASAVPSVAERFSEEANPTHVLLIVDSRTGETIRAEGGEEAENRGFPAGGTARFLLALAGLEEGSLDRDTSAECDSTCWTGGSHGRVDMVSAFAYSCDTWFRQARGEVDAAALRAHAGRAGFEVGLPPEGSFVDSAGFPPPDWTVTARQWVDFWTSFPRGRMTRRTAATSTLLAATATTVSSPRGVGRALADPSRLVRAVIGETEDGAWVVGTRRVRGTPAWSYALYMHGGTGPLAASRADHLLRETIRAWRHSTKRRVEEEPVPLDLKGR